MSGEKTRNAHLVVSQNFVFQNRASRSCKAHLHVSQNFVFRIVHAPCRWSLAGLFAMQTKNAGADEKTKLLPTSSRVMPIKGFRRNPPQWAEGHACFVSVPRPAPLSNQPAAQALRELDNSPRSGCLSSNRPCHRGTVRSPDMAANDEATAVPN